MSELRCSYFIPPRPIEYPVLPPYFITIKFGLILIMLCTLIIFYDCEFDLIFFHTPVEDIHILWGSMLIIAVIQLLSSGPPNPHVYRRLNSSSFQTFNTCNKCSTTYRLSVSEWIRWKAVSLSILCYSMQTCPSHSVCLKLPCSKSESAACQMPKTTGTNDIIWAWLSLWSGFYIYTSALVNLGSNCE